MMKTKLAEKIFLGITFMPPYLRSTLILLTRSKLYRKLKLVHILRGNLILSLMFQPILMVSRHSYRINMVYYSEIKGYFETNHQP